MSLTVRSLAEEQMDAEDLDPAVYAAVVGDLAKVNRMTMAARPTLSFIRRALGARTPLPWGERATRGSERGEGAPGRSRLAQSALTRTAVPSRPLTAGERCFRLLDVGFGQGDMLRSIARLFPDADLVGVDLNPRSEAAARAVTPPDMNIRYVTGDYAELGGEPWDFIISSLVAHHMTHDQLVAFVRFMDAHARRGWLVNDLHRHRLAHLGFPALATVMRWHPMVKADGRLSIARSYRPGEWAPILQEAGVKARVYRAFPYRLCVETIR
jgi:SAM-dependent methyltransferase